MSNKDENLEQEQSTSKRRNILKSIAVGGGAVATAASLPQIWTKPVLNQVVLPAHADMSEEVVPEPEPVIEGTFVTDQPVAINFMRNKGNGSGFAESQYALLDLLVAPAQASHATLKTFCGTNNGNENGDGQGNTNGGSNIYFRVNANGTVDVAIDDLLSDDSFAEICGVSSTLTDTTIADFVLVVNVAFTGATKAVSFTNVVASATEISGDYQTVGNDDDDAGTCNGSFTAPIGGIFPTATDCSIDD